MGLWLRPAMTPLLAGQLCKCTQPLADPTPPQIPAINSLGKEASVFRDLHRQLLPSNGEKGTEVGLRLAKSYCQGTLHSIHPSAAVQSSSAVQPLFQAELGRTASEYAERMAQYVSQHVCAKWSVLFWQAVRP